MCSLRGYYEICGMHPDGKGQVIFYLSIKKLQQIQRYGPEWKFENARLLEESLKSPTTIFEGLKRKDMDAAYCYAARPGTRYRKGGTIETPFSLDRILVIYVDPMPRGKGLEIIDWAIREEDDTKSGFPKQWQDDFSRKIWPPT